MNSGESEKLTLTRKSPFSVKGKDIMIMTYQPTCKRSLNACESDWKK